jgi:hypothetical protein
VRGGLASYLPTTEEGIYFWMAVLSLAYMGAATAIQVRATSWLVFERQIFGRIFEFNYLLDLGGVAARANGTRSLGRARKHQTVSFYRWLGWLFVCLLCVKTAKVSTPIPLCGLVTPPAWPDIFQYAWYFLPYENDSQYR